MIDVDRTRTSFINTLFLCLCVAWGTAGPAAACTTVLAGRLATVDGSVLIASSCDGDVMGVIHVMPAQTYPPDTKLPMYWNLPRPKTYQEYEANVRKGYDLVGHLPTTETYRSIILGGNLESMTTGGLNEHGVSIAIEFLPMRSGLACDKGVVGPNSNHWTTSLIANGLLRAKTAREAIRVIGSMIFDLTEHPAFRINDQKSPLARPWGPVELFELLRIEPQRALCTPTSGYVFVAQLRDWLPDAVGDCLWFAYGPASTSCFVPVYAGVTDLPDTWDQPANFTRLDRAQPQWNFRLVHNLANSLRYQEAVKDIQQVLEPAEERYLAIQADVERSAVQVFEKYGPRGAESFLTDYTGQSAIQVGVAYDELVDFLMYKYLVGDAELAPQPLPEIAPPIIPAFLK